MTDRFYEKQIEKIEASEKLKEFEGLINDYLEASSTEDAKIIKDLIIKKATSELTTKELNILKENLSKRGQNETGKNKMKLYELAAGLYNNVPLTPQSPTQLQILQLNQQERLNENIPPFEVVGGKVTKKVLTFSGIKEKTYEIVGANIEHIGGGKYRVNLEYSRKVGKYGKSSGSDSIVIGFKGGNAIQIFDSNGEKRLGIVPIQNSVDIYESGQSENGKYSRRIQKRNSMISFEVKEYGSKIELLLAFPGR